MEPKPENAALDAAGQTGTAVELNMDAQFGGSDLVASLLEEGYEVTTKASSPATVARLRRAEARGKAVFGTWEPVSANAEVAECRQTNYAGCPHPLRLLGYRKHLAASASRPARTTYALVLTSVAEAERSAVRTIDHYHQRGGTVELLNRQAKSYLRRRTSGLGRVDQPGAGTRGRPDRRRRGRRPVSPAQRLAEPHVASRHPAPVASARLRLARRPGQCTSDVP